MEHAKNHIDQILFEEIEAYLLQTMGQAERSGFEQRMASDPELQQEVQLQRQLLAIVEVGSFTQPELASGTPVKSLTIAKSRFKPWLAAAAVLVLVAAVWFLYQPSNNPQTLANHYFQPDPGLPVTMSSTHQYQFYDGMVSYKEADYEKALSIWKELSTTAPSDTLQYYMGLAQLNHDQYTEAIKQLQPLAQGSGNWKHKAAWYLSIAYLRLNKVPEAIKWLQTIPNNNEAKELLNQLKKLSAN